jgi:hypothetical protein
MRLVARILGVVGVMALLTPGIAVAQAVIAGAVKDASGAVLPGVTVEAASPALIEKVRTAVTDGNGLSASRTCGLAPTSSPSRYRAFRRFVATASRSRGR